MAIDVEKKSGNCELLHRELYYISYLKDLLGYSAEWKHDGHMVYAFENGPVYKLWEFVTQAATLRMNLRQKVELCRSIAVSLKKLHDRGIIHLGLDLNSIMVEGNLETSEIRNVFLVNLGYAHVLPYCQAYLAPMSDYFHEDPLYMSPELARKSQCFISYQSDIYCLGTIFFKIITGDDLFVSIDREVILNDHTYTSVHFEKYSLPDSLTSIIQKSLQKSPEFRYQNIESLISGLSNFLQIDETQIMSQRFAVQLPPLFQSSIVKSIEKALHLSRSSKPQFILISDVAVLSSSHLFNTMMVSSHETLFLKGSFSEATVAYTPLIEICRQLFRWILSLPDSEAREIKREIGDIVEHVEGIVEFIPEIKKLFPDNKFLPSIPTETELISETIQNIFSIFGQKGRSVCLWMDHGEKSGNFCLSILERILRKNINICVVVTSDSVLSTKREFPLQKMLRSIKKRSIGVSQLSPSVNVSDFAEDMLKQTYNEIDIHQAIKPVVECGKNHCLLMSMAVYRLHKLQIIEESPANIVHRLSNDIILSCFNDLSTSCQNLLKYASLLSHPFSIKEMELITKKDSKYLFHDIVEAIENGFLVEIFFRFELNCDNIRENILLILDSKEKAELNQDILFNSINLSNSIRSTENISEIWKKYHSHITVNNVSMESKENYLRYTLGACKRLIVASLPKTASNYLNSAMQMIENEDLNPKLRSKIKIMEILVLFTMKNHEYAQEKALELLQSDTLVDHHLFQVHSILMGCSSYTQNYSIFLQFIEKLHQFPLMKNFSMDKNLKSIISKKKATIEKNLKSVNSEDFFSSLKRLKKDKRATKCAFYVLECLMHAEFLSWFHEKGSFQLIMLFGLTAGEILFQFGVTTQFLPSLSFLSWVWTAMTKSIEPFSSLSQVTKDTVEKSSIPLCISRSRRYHALVTSFGSLPTNKLLGNFKLASMEALSTEANSVSYLLQVLIALSNGQHISDTRIIVDRLLKFSGKSKTIENLGVCFHAYLEFLQGKELLKEFAPKYKGKFPESRFHHFIHHYVSMIVQLFQGEFEMALKSLAEVERYKNEAAGTPLYLTIYFFSSYLNGEIFHACKKNDKRKKDLVTALQSQSLKSQEHGSNAISIFCRAEYLRTTEQLTLSTLQMFQEAYVLSKEREQRLMSIFISFRILNLFDQMKFDQIYIETALLESLRSIKSLGAISLVEKMLKDYNANHNKSQFSYFEKGDRATRRKNFEQLLDSQDTQNNNFFILIGSIKVAEGFFDEEESLEWINRFSNRMKETIENHSGFFHSIDNLEVVAFFKEADSVLEASNTMINQAQELERKEDSDKISLHFGIDKGFVFHGMTSEPFIYGESIKSVKRLVKFAQKLDLPLVATEEVKLMYDGTKLTSNFIGSFNATSPINCNSFHRVYIMSEGCEGSISDNSFIEYSRALKMFQDKKFVTSSNLFDKIAKGAFHPDRKPHLLSILCRKACLLYKDMKLPKRWNGEILVDEYLNPFPFNFKDPYQDKPTPKSKQMSNEEISLIKGDLTQQRETVLALRSSLSKAQFENQNQQAELSAMKEEILKLKSSLQQKEIEQRKSKQDLVMAERKIATLKKKKMGCF